MRRSTGSPTSRHLLYAESTPFVCPLEHLNLARLRLAFAPLFERAARAVQLAGFEQDDAIIDRYLTCRDDRVCSVTPCGWRTRRSLTPGGWREKAVLAEWLSHRERLIRAVCSAFDATSAEGIRLTGLKVEAVRDSRLQWYDLDYGPGGIRRD